MMSTGYVPPWLYKDGSHSLWCQTVEELFPVRDRVASVGSGNKHRVPGELRGPGLIYHPAERHV